MSWIIFEQFFFLQKYGEKKKYQLAYRSVVTNPKIKESLRIEIF
jgi:hypothetical protein